MNQINIELSKTIYHAHIVMNQVHLFTVCTTLNRNQYSMIFDQMIPSMSIPFSLLRLSFALFKSLYKSQRLSLRWRLKPMMYLSNFPWKKLDDEYWFVDLNWFVPALTTFRLQFVFIRSKTTLLINVTICHMLIP